MASGLDVKTTVPSAQSEGSNVVERLRATMKRLAETESNKRLFQRMIERRVATNDVRNFVKKQADIKKAEHSMNLRMVKTSMRAKLLDTCALAKKLRS